MAGTAAPLVPDPMLSTIGPLAIVLQASTVVWLLVVWQRKRHFSGPLRRLSWYVYLSLGCSVWGQLHPLLFATNHWSIITFNLGKIALFGAVYARVLTAPLARRLVLATTAGALVFSLSFLGFGTSLLITVSRVVQGAVLAAFALVYLEQSLAQPGSGPKGAHDPLWLLSVGQLLCSAGAVTSSSLDYFSKTVHDQLWNFVVIIIVGMVFNAFLTMAFWQAGRRRQPAPAGLPGQP